MGDRNSSTLSGQIADQYSPVSAKKRSARWLKGSRPTRSRPTRNLPALFRIAAVTVMANLLFFPQSLPAQADASDNIRSVLILHTNDMHDHLRADYDGVGGLPFVSGFVRSVRDARDDVIMMDAGDVAEKGDLVARRTDSELTFKAMGRVGYDVWAPGNHDHDFGIEALYRFTELANMDIVCINLLKEDGTTEFPPSNIYNINGVRIGVIGAIQPRSELSLNMEETAEAMAVEAERLKPDTDLIVAVVHISIANSIFIAETAPDIDVIVSGHSHQETREPVVVTGTGALIVQSGQYATNVGWLELQVDLQSRRIDSYDYKLVAMNHLEILPDLEMIEMVRQKELELSPEAFRVVSWSPRVVSRVEVGILAAEALRKKTGADIALHKTAHIVRASVPKGILDVNAFYRTGGERGEFLIEAELSGSEINNYIQALPMNNWRLTNWSGFYGSYQDGIFTSDLEPDRMYTVVMPEREWRQRFVRLYNRIERNPDDWPGIVPPGRSFEARDIETRWIEAVTSLLVEYKHDNRQLLDSISEIARQTGQTLQLVSYR